MKAKKKKTEAILGGDPKSLKNVMIAKILSDDKYLRNHTGYQNGVRDVAVRLLEAEFHRARYFYGELLTGREALLVKCLECMDRNQEERECPDNTHTCPLYRNMFMPDE